MKIDLKKITVRDLVEDYHDDGEGGVRGYGGKLDIRPPFQREFVYKDKQRDAVIETINKGFPLNVMYWAVRQDGTYEVIDGQQRTISAAQYVESDYSLDGRYFHNLQDDEQERILHYPLQVYVCEGSGQREAGLVQDHQHRRRKADRPRVAECGLCWPVGIRREAVFQPEGGRKVRPMRSETSM